MNYQHVKAKCWKILITRFVVIFLIMIPFFWYLFPFNNVNHSFKKGYGFWQDNIDEFTFPYTDASATTLIVNVTNANVYFFHNGDNAAEVRFKVYTPSGAIVQKVNATLLRVEDNVLTNVVSQVQIFLPFAPQRSPSMIIFVDSISNDFRRSHLDIIDSPMRPENALFDNHVDMDSMHIRAYLSFLNLTNHRINHLNVDITELRAELRKIEGVDINIRADHGYIYYRIYENEPAVLTRINQPYSAYCIASPFMHNVSSTPGCAVFADRDTKIPFNDDGFCQINGDPCECVQTFIVSTYQETDTSKTTQNLNLKNADGPIVIEQWNGQDPYDIKHFDLAVQNKFREDFIFSGVSYLRFNQAKSFLESHTSFNQFSRIEVMFSQYHAVWIGYNNDLYLRSSASFIDVFSFTVMGSKYMPISVYSMSGRCPPTREPINYNDPFYNNEVQKGLEKQVSRSFAMARGRDSFDNFSERLAGEAIASPLQIVQKPWLVVYILITLILAVLITASVIYFVWMCRTKFETDSRIETNMGNRLRLLGAKMDGENISAEEERNLRERVQVHDSMYKYFFYMMSELNLHILKKEFLNSLTLFLLDAPVNPNAFEPLYFDTDRLNLLQRRPGMLLKEFQEFYFRYCNFNNLFPRETYEEKEVLNAFGINLTTKRAPAFRFIRWRNQGEVWPTEHPVKYESLIEQFLIEECIVTDLEADIIFYRDMVLRFQQFCLTKGRSPEQEMLLPETILLYAEVVFDEYDEVLILEGVTRVGALHITDTGKLQGMALQYDHTKITKPFCKCKTNGFWVFFCSRNIRSKEYVLYNIALTLMHSLPTLVLCFFFAIILGLIVNTNILGSTTLGYSCMPYEIFLPWRLSRCTVIPFISIFYILLGLAFFRYIWLYYIGFTKASWKLTLNVRKSSICTKIILISEMSAFGFFIFVFVIAFFIILLGAFKNPMTYIAFGTAIFIFIYFIVYETNKIDKRLLELDLYSRGVVQDQLNEMVKEKRQIKIDRLQKQESKESTQQGNILQEFRDVLQDDNRWTLPQIESAISLQSNQEVEKLAQSLSLDPAMLKAVLSLKNKEYEAFFKQVEELCKLSGTDPTIGVFIASLALTQYNPDAQGVNTVAGEATKYIRPFLLSKFGDLLNSSKIDALLQLLLECDIRALKQLPDVLQIPPNVLEYFGSLQRREHSTELLQKLISEIFPSSITNTTDLLIQAKKKVNSPQDFKDIAQIFSKVMLVQDSTIMEAAAAVAQKDPWLERIALSTIMTKIVRSIDLTRFMEIEQKLQLSIFSLHSLGRAANYDLDRVLKAVERETDEIQDRQRIIELSRVIQGDLKAVPQLCAHLGFSKGSVIQDLFSLAWGFKIVPLELTAALDLHYSQGVVLWHFIELNVIGELVKRFITNQKFSRICQILKRRYLKALSFFSGVYKKEDKKSSVLLFNLSTSQARAKRMRQTKMQEQKEESSFFQIGETLQSKGPLNFLINTSSNSADGSIISRRQFIKDGVAQGPSQEKKKLPKVKPLGVQKLESILKDVDQHVLKTLSRRQHRVVRAIAELIFNIYSKEIQQQNSTNFGSLLKKSRDRESLVGRLFSFVKEEANTEESEFGSALRRQEEQAEEETEKFNEVVARFLEITTFELKLLSDVMRKNVGEIFKEMDVIEVEIERQAQFDKRNFLFSLALQLQKQQLESIRVQWNLACREAGGYSLVTSQALGKILDTAEVRILSSLADIKREVLTFQPVDLVEFQLQQSAQKVSMGYLNGEPVAKVIRALKNDEAVNMNNPKNSDRLSRIMTYVRLQSPDKALKLVKQFAGESKNLTNFIYLLMMAGKSVSVTPSDSFIEAQLNSEVDKLTEYFNVYNEDEGQERVAFERQSRIRKSSVLLQLFQKNLFREFSLSFLGRQKEEKKEGDKEEFEDLWEVERKRGVNKRVDSVLALVLGTAIRDTDLMRQAYAEIFGSNDREMRIISGLISVLTDNTSEQVHIRKFARFIGADPSTALNLMYLHSKDQRLIKNAVKALVWKNISLSKSRILVDILCIRNHVLHDLSHLSSALGLQNSQFKSFLCAVAGVDGSASFNTTLSNYCNFTGSSIVSDFIKLTHTSHPKTLLQDSNKLVLHPKIKALTKALFTLQHLSRDLQFFKLNQLELEMAITVIKEWVVNKWSKTLLNESKYFGGRKENQETDVTSRLNEFVDLLLRALFNDYFCILDFGEGLLHLPDMHNATKNDVKVQIMRAHFRLLEQQLKQDQKQIYEKLLLNQAQVRKDLTRLSKTNRSAPAKKDQSHPNQDYQAFLSKCDTECQQRSIVTKCTFNSFQFIPFSQRYYTCLTCTVGNRKYLICEPCAFVCHAKHTLSLQNYGRPSLVVCECGKGKFANSIMINNSHSLEQMPRSDCFFRQSCFYSASELDQISRETSKAALTFLDTMNNVLCMKPQWYDLFMIYDFELGRDVSLWQNLIYLCRGKCRNSFIAALLSDLDSVYDPQNASSLASIYPYNTGLQLHLSRTSAKASSQSYEMVSALLALEAGDYMNFSRFSDSFVNIYRLPQSPDYPAVLRLTELMMVIHNPFRLIPNYNEFLGVYEKLLRKIFDNSWVKVVPFHMIALCCSDESEVMDFLLQTNRQSSSLNLTTYFIEKIDSHIVNDVLHFSAQQTRLLGGLLQISARDQKGLLSLLSIGESSTNFFNCQVFINPTLKNFVPILETYMRGFRGIQNLFTGIYGDVDSLYAMSALNFQGMLCKQAFEKLHYLYNLASRMISKSYLDIEMYPEQIAVKLEVLPQILHLSEKANYKMLFGSEGNDAVLAEALIKVAAQQWNISHLNEIANFKNIKRKKQRLLLFYALYAFHGNMYAFGQIMQMLTEAGDQQDNKLLDSSDHRYPGYYFQLFGYARDQGNLRKQLQDFEEEYTARSRAASRSNTGSAFQPMALLTRLKGNLETVAQDKNEGLETEEFEKLRSPSTINQLMASILPSSESIIGSFAEKDLTPLISTLKRFMDIPDARVQKSLDDYAESEEGRKNILLLEAVLARKESSLRNMLAFELKGAGNKTAAATELFDVFRRSPRIGQIAQLLETFVEEKIIEEDLLDEPPSLASQQSEEDEGEQDDGFGGFLNEPGIEEQEQEHSLIVPEKRLSIQRSKRQLITTTTYQRVIPYIVNIELGTFEEEKKQGARRGTRAPDKQLYQNREKDILTSFGISQSDINRGFSYELVIGSNNITIRPDKVIQLLLNTSDGLACGGSLSQYSANANVITTCGPNQGLLMIALLSLIYLKNPSVKSMLDLCRLALGFDRSRLLDKLLDILRLFLTQQDFTTPEIERLRQLEHWLRLIIALIQKDSASHYKGCAGKEREKERTSNRRATLVPIEENEKDRMNSLNEMPSIRREGVVESFQIEALVSDKLGVRITNQNLEQYLKLALGSTENIKAEQFNRIVKIYTGIYYLCRLDLQGMEWLSSQLQCFELKKLEGFIKIIDRKQFYEKELKEEIKHDLKQIEGVPLSHQNLKQVFIKYDFDKSGAISFQEFQNVCAYMGINRSKELLLNIFVNADDNINNAIDQTQFFNAVELLKVRIAQDALRELGYTSKTMYSIFFARLVVLLLILIYLVMGLQLFSTSDDFINLILNAALPILVGVLFFTYVNLDRQKQELKKMVKHVFHRWKGTQESND